MEIKNERELIEGFQSTIFVIDENKRLNSTLDNHIVDSIPIHSKAFEVKNVVQIKKMDSSVPSQLLWTGDCDILDTNLWDSKHMTYDTDLKYCDLDELLYNGTDLQLENQTIILENDATASCSNSYSVERHHHHDTNFMTILYTPRVEQDQSSDQSDQLISSPSGPLSPTDSNISFTSSNIEFESRTRTLSDEEIKYKESKNQTRQSSLTNLNGNTTEMDSQKDEKYWARRKKNNIAAKRSRDARRKKENQVAIRAAFLENENKYLRQENERLKMENFTLSGNLMKLNSPVEDQK